MKENLTAKQSLFAYELSGVREITTNTPVNRMEKRPNPVLTAEPTKEETKQDTAPINASSLYDLKKSLETFTYCSLKKTAMNTVFADGNPESSVMLIGEAPGAEEDRKGLPFVGASGKLLDKMLASIGLFREKNCYITNVLPWRPPGNRTPNPSEVNACLPFLKKHIEIINPKIMVLLGSSPLNALMGGSGYAITRVRGQWFDYKGIPALATLHPAFLLRSPAQKKNAWLDMQSLRQKIETLAES